MPLRAYVIRVKTLDLLTSCPIWRLMFDPGGVRLDLYSFRRERALREKWSHKLVEIATPVQGNRRSLVGLRDGMTYSQWFFYERCQTSAYWRVVGPQALLDDLAEEPQNPDPGARKLNLLLCQHEIRGD